MRKTKCVIDDPAWVKKGACVEDHTKLEVKYVYTTTVTCLTPFNMPTLNHPLTLQLEKVASILPGAVLWNPKVGYLHVKYFDEDTSSVIVYNHDERGNKAIGAAVLANEKFHVGVPQVVGAPAIDYSNTPMLAADFISPIETGTTTVSVTSINGLAEETQVSIQGYVYNLKTILDRSTIVLEHVKGKSAAPGQVIEFDPNKCGNPSVAVVAFLDNPCGEVFVTEGRLVACYDGMLAPLQGLSDGQLLVWDNSQEKWVLKNNNFQEMCAALSRCLIVDTTEVSDDDDETNDATYLVYVTKTSVFSVGNKINIGGTTFIVREVLDSEKMRITPESTPAEPLSYNRGTAVCIEECCTWVPTKLDNTVDSPTWRPKSLQDVGYAYVYEAFKDSTELQNVVLQSGDGNTQSITVQQDGNTIFNEDPNSKITVSCRCYGLLRGMSTLATHPSPSSISELDLNLKRLVIRTKLEIYRILPDGTKELANPATAVMRHNFPLMYNKNNPDQEKNPHHVFYSDEVLYEVPEYDASNPENSKVTFSAKWTVDRLGSSDPESKLVFNQSDSNANGYISVKIVTEGIRQ
jgi:hypothetical protein